MFLSPHFKFFLLHLGDDSVYAARPEVTHTRATWIVYEMFCKKHLFAIHVYERDPNGPFVIQLTEALDNEH